MPPTALRQDGQSKQEASLYSRTYRVTARTPIQMAASSRTEVSAGCSVPGLRVSCPTSNGYMSSLPRANSAAAARSSSSLHRCLPCAPTAPGVLSRSAGTPHHTTSLGTTVASKAHRSNSTPRPRTGVSAGLSTATTTAASPVPGRAKAVLASAGSTNSSSSLTRAASLGLSPALVASTSNPKRLGSTESYAALSNAAKKAAAAGAAKHTGSRAAGLSTALSARYGAEQTPLKQGLQCSSSGTAHSRTSTYDAIAVEHCQVRPQVPQHGVVGRDTPMVEPLTYPGITARSQSHSTGVQMAASSASAARSSGQASQQPATTSSNGLCGVGSPTNNGFLDRLHSRNQNLAAAAAVSGESGLVAQVSSSGATSSFNVAMERLKALSFNHRDASRSSSSGAEPLMPVSTSNTSIADGSTSMQQQRPNISHGNILSCSSCDPATAAAAAHASSVEALIARNRQQFAESLPSLAVALAESGSGQIQGFSYSSVAASGAGAGTRFELQGRLSSETSLGSLSSPPVRISSRMHRQATAGASTELDAVASRTATMPAGMQDTLHSSPSRCVDGIKGLYHQPAAGVVQQQRPVYDPARYTTAAAVNGHQQLSLDTTASSGEAVRRTSSGGSAGGNVVNGRDLYTSGVTATSTGSPFAANQQVSPGSSSYCVRSGNGGSHIIGLTDGPSSSSKLHGGSAANGTFYHSHQQQPQQASLARLTSSASTAGEASRQLSFLIGTHSLSEHEDDSRRLAATSIGDAVGGAAACTSSLVVSSAITTAAELQSRQDFLAGNIPSRSSSLMRSAAAAAAGGSSGVLQSCGLGQAPQQQHSLTQAGLYGSHELLQSQQQQHPHGRAAVPVVECYSDSDSDISEMSSSLQKLGGSSDDSDSDEGVTTTVAARRRLVGQRVMLGSSVSVSSTDGRSSSVGSGKELDVICSTGKHVLRVVAPANRGRGLPCGCVGLNNLGNTCFMNSILQCLNCLPELVVALLGRRAAQQIQTAGGPFTTGLHRTSAAALGVQWHPRASVGPAFGDLLAEMWSMQQHSLCRQQAISPRQFLRAVAVADERWGDGCQQDSQEFLHSLLEQLQKECNRVQEKPQYKELSGKGTEAEQAAEAGAYARSWHDSLVDDLFGGFLQSTVTCSNCHHQSHCFDPFLDLSVPIPNSKQVSVQDCLSAFFEDELLTGSEQVRCSACKKTCDATKRLQVFDYPKLLVLSLKRFNSCSKGGETGFRGSWCSAFSPVSKNQTPVTIHGEQPLDLAPCCSSTGLKVAAGKGGKGGQTARYELLAVSKHSGCLGGGHYTAQGRSVVDGQWHHFNDCSVTADSCPTGSSSSAYVLFYRLLDGRASSGASSVRNLSAV